MKILKNIRKSNAVIYLFGDLLSRATPFILIPIISKTLGTESLAYYSNYFLLLFIVQSILTMFVVPYLNVLFFKDNNKYLQIVNYLVGNQNAILLATLLFAIFLLFLFNDIMFMIFLLSVFFSVSINFYLNHLQVNRFAKKYSVINFLKGGGYLILALVGVFSNIITVKYLLISNFIILALLSLYSFRNLNALSKFKNSNIDISILLPAIIFGLPLIPSLLINSIRTTIDRYYILGGFDLSTMGLYAGVYQIASLIMIFSASLVKTYSPSIMESYVNQDFNKVRNLILKSSGIILILSFFVNFFLYEFGYLLLSDTPSYKIQIFSFLSWVFCFQSISSFFTSYYQFFDKTRLILFINLVSLFFYYVFVVYLATDLNSFVLLAISVSLMNLFPVIFLGGYRVLKGNK
ncbi:TPA: hypothetical protein KDZ96_001109 [Vibrio parahaemolyticus]|nr:hypothetical protein [Vibrio parahaemolyticus]